MTYRDYVIDNAEWAKYKRGEVSKLHQIWQDILRHVPEEQREEAKKSGLVVQEGELVIANFYRKLKLVPADASPELQKVFRGIMNQVLLLTDEY